MGTLNGLMLSEDGLAEKNAATICRARFSGTFLRQSTLISPLLLLAQSSCGAARKEGKVRKITPQSHRYLVSCGSLGGVSTRL